MLNRKKNIIVEKSERFADRIVKMCDVLRIQREGDKDMLRQVGRSGTSIGANISEGLYAQSGPDFISKFSIALKEANETRYWLDRLYTKGLLNQEEYDSMHSDNMEIIYILISIIKTMKLKQDNIQKAKEMDNIEFVDNNHQQV